MSDSEMGLKNTLIEKSVIILLPCYNDWESLVHLIPKINAVFSPLKTRIKIFIIDDFSSSELNPDEDYAEAALDAVESVIRVRLVRNVGSQRSIAIGLAYLAAKETADYLIVADADHQDRPEDMPKLLRECARYDNKKIIFARRSKRLEGLLFRLSYFIYQKIFKIFANVEISMGSFSSCPWPHVPRLSNLSEMWNHFPSAVIKSKIPYEQIDCIRGRRIYGESSMRLAALVAVAFNAFAIFSETIAARLLILGFYSICSLFTIGVGLVGLKLFSDIPLLGWTSIVISLLATLTFQIFAVSGIMLFLISFMRMQAPTIPKYEYEKFIFDIDRIYPKQN